MNIHVVVPVKALARAKSRLAAHIDPAERRALVLEMLQRVLGTLLACRDSTPAVVAEVWVVSADPTVRELATMLGARTILDRTSELNAALEQARTLLTEARAAALLVLPADVPLTTAADIAGLAAALADADVVLADDNGGGGTNALGMRLPSALPFCFGLQSAILHQAAAETYGLSLQRYSSPTLGLDVDDPASLERYRDLAGPVRCDVWLCTAPPTGG